MKKPKFEVGEWCFCEFELQMIKRTEEDRITGVTTGIMELGSSDLSDRCYPLDIKIKRISDSVEYWSKQFHAIKTPGVNHPDLNRELIRRWVEMCEAKDNEKELKSLYESLDRFGSDFINAVENARRQSIEGVQIFR